MTSRVIHEIPHCIVPDIVAQEAPSCHHRSAPFATGYGDATLNVLVKFHESVTHYAEWV